MYQSCFALFVGTRWHPPSNASWDRIYCEYRIKLPIVAIVIVFTVVIGMSVITVGYLQHNLS